MTTITIPQNLIKEKDLILIPRRKYDELLRMTGKKKRAHTQLDKDLGETIARYRAGEYFGPFDTTKALIKSLKSKK